MKTASHYSRKPFRNLLNFGIFKKSRKARAFFCQVTPGTQRGGADQDLSEAVRVLALRWKRPSLTPRAPQGNDPGEGKAGRPFPTILPNWKPYFGRVIGRMALLPEAFPITESSWTRHSPGLASLLEEVAVGPAD